MASGSSDDIGPGFASFLDFARALSALLVFANHLRVPLFVNYPDLAAGQRTPLVRIWFFASGFGFAAMVVFFVLSGFLVGGLGWRRVRDDRFRPAEYFAARFARLFIVFVPALVLTALLDRIGLAWFRPIGLWDLTNPVLASKFILSFAALDGWSTFVCNLAMLQPFRCLAYGSDVPLWSLSYEFWLYVAFGMAAIAARATAVLRLVCAIVCAAILLLLGHAFLVMAAIWGFGALAFAYRGTRLRQPLIAVPLFLIAAAMVRIEGFSYVPETRAQAIASLFEGAAFAWVLLSLRGLALRPLIRSAPFGAWLASFSYTLYLIHFPLMLIVIAVLAKLLGLGTMAQGLPPHSAIGPFVYFATILIVMAIAWLIAQLTERHTPALRRWLVRRFAAA